jgi:hypothetical protein
LANSSDAANEPVPIVPKTCPESVEGFNRYAQVKSFTETNTELRNFVVKEDSEISPLRREGRRVKFFIKDTPNFTSLCGESSFTVNPAES